MSPNEHSIADRTLAMAGICQAALLVKELARNGTLDRRDLETCMYSIYQTDPPSVVAVFGKVGALRTGLNEVIEQLGRRSPHRDLEIARYVTNLLALSRHLSKRSDLLAAIARGIERAHIQSTHFSITHDNVLANLASIYTENVSRLTPRIMVGGEPHFLAVPENQNTIRALLLAGIRSAILWRQCGGSAWYMLFKHREVAAEADRLLHEEARTATD